MPRHSANWAGAPPTPAGDRGSPRARSHPRSRKGCGHDRDARAAEGREDGARRSRDMSPHEHLLDELRPVAFAIAYRMLGSVSEAEDVVQESLLRVHQTLEAGEPIASP